MSAPNAEPAPKGGLTARQELKLGLQLTVPFSLFSMVVMRLFPGLPLVDPFMGALLALVPAFYPFPSLTRPVARRQLTRFIVLADLSAVATMLLVAMFLSFAGLMESFWLEIVIGFGGTYLIVWCVNWRIFRIVIGATDQAPDQRESSP